MPRTAQPRPGGVATCSKESRFPFNPLLQLIRNIFSCLWRILDYLIGLVDQSIPSTPHLRKYSIRRIMRSIEQLRAMRFKLSTTGCNIIRPEVMQEKIFTAE